MDVINEEFYDLFLPPIPDLQFSNFKLQFDQSLALQQRSLAQKNNQRGPHVRTFRFQNERSPKRFDTRKMDEGSRTQWSSIEKSWHIPGRVYHFFGTLSDDSENEEEELKLETFRLRRFFKSWGNGYITRRIWRVLIPIFQVYAYLKEHSVSSHSFLFLKVQLLPVTTSRFRHASFSSHNLCLAERFKALAPDTSPTLPHHNMPHYHFHQPCSPFYPTANKLGGNSAGRPPTHLSLSVDNCAK